MIARLWISGQNEIHRDKKAGRGKRKCQHNNENPDQPASDRTRKFDPRLHIKFQLMYIQFSEQRRY